MARPQFFHSRKPVVKAPLLFRRPQAHQVTLMIVPHAHLQALVDGRGTEDEFLTVAFRVAVGSSLTAFADDEDQKPLNEVFLASLNSLIAVGERYERLGKFGCNGDELTNLKEGLNLTDDLQAVTTRRQLLEMYKQVQGIIGGFSFTMTNLRLMIEKVKEQ